MSYTVWSRGRLLGETELAYRQTIPGLRAGDFFPNELGEKLMPVIDGMGPALFALYDAEEEAERADPDARRVDGYAAPVLKTTEYADVMSIADELESLRLELRDSAGAVVPTDHLWIQDTHRLLSQRFPGEDELDDEELTDEMRAAVEHDVQIMLEHFEELENRKPWEEDGGDRPWDPRNDRDDEAEQEFPRYQIFVHLAGYEPFGRSAYPSD